MFDWVGDLVRDVVEGDYLFVVAAALLAASGVWRLLVHPRLPSPDGRLKRFFGLTFQIGMTLMLERLYEFSRAHVAVGQITALAYSHGWMLADFEITHGFFIEHRLEAMFLHANLLMHLIYGFYAFAHLFVTLAFLIWLYLRRNEVFPFVRNLFYLTTGVALVIYMTFPAAPPRLLSPLGFTDPSQVLGFTQAGGAQLTELTYNPYAAMPSLHLVYALIVGGTLAFAGRRLWLRAAGSVYPFVMLAVVLISANHWVLDAVGALVVTAASALVLFATRAGVRFFRSLAADGFRLSSA